MKNTQNKNTLMLET